ncbi:MAG: hypothetical protein WC900_03450 [Oscillospiraceae bacterium]|jgi:hypothetical protein
MTVTELSEKCGFKILNMNEAGIDISGVYCCDLLSVVMGRAFSHCAWVTVMGNINSIAVATLADISCIVLSDTAALDESALAKARQQRVTVLKSQLPIFETALEIHKAVGNA